MNPKYNVTRADLEKYLRYDKEFGKFRGHKSDRLLGADVNGYVNICVTFTRRKYTRYREHALVWFFETGEWPKLTIDHIDGDRKNNVFSNLRELTQGHNNQNIGSKSIGRSGLLGVSYIKAGNIRKRYKAEISIDGRSTYLGTYLTAEEAHQAYLIAKAKYHPYADRITNNGALKNE